MPFTGIANLANSPGDMVCTVQRYLWPLWHDVLSTSDRAKAYALKANVGEKMRVVEFGSGKRPAKAPASPDNAADHAPSNTARQRAMAEAGRGA